MRSIVKMYKPGKASFIIGGQWGSEGKGAAAAYLAVQTAKEARPFGLITTNAGAQAGHTSVHNGRTRVAFHLPTASLVYRELGLEPYSYLNAGAIIDPKVLLKELDEEPLWLEIHPNAAVITDADRAAEGARDSAQTKIASTRKGVGEALSRKVLRSGLLAKDCDELRPFVKARDLNDTLGMGQAILAEVPQGISLSVNGDFYPHCTSRNCTVQQAMSDADIHPSCYGASLLVMRTYPIRVGNIVENGEELGNSGGCYPDQWEVSWADLGVKPEITTVTKRVRRVFTFSRQQLHQAMRLTRPEIVYLTFCDYPGTPGQPTLDEITRQIYFASAMAHGPRPLVLYQYGPSTDDVSEQIRR